MTRIRRSFCLLLFFSFVYLMSYYLKSFKGDAYHISMPQFLSRNIIKTRDYIMRSANLVQSNSSYTCSDANTSAISSFNASSNSISNPGAKKFVSLCPVRFSGRHGTGNHIFMLAAVLYVAKVTGRTAVMPKNNWLLDNTFDIKLNRTQALEKELCPCDILYIPHFSYDVRLDDVKFLRSLADSNKTILVCGLAQTHRYAHGADEELRKILQFRPETVSYGKKFIFNNFKKGFLHIGVHIRRGDYMAQTELDYGLTVVNDNLYLKHAIEYLQANSTQLIQFIIATDDWKWTEANLPSMLDIVPLRNQTAAQDLQVLSLCDGLIMSTGSFGYWAGWIGNGTMVYYKNWPRTGSILDGKLNRNDYFPKHWIPLL